MVVQVMGCGTLMYPERRGQKAGAIDPGVAILDGIGLIFFIIPGLIAFAVDFSTGAIYLPAGKKKSSPSDQEVKVVQIHPSALNEHTIKEIVIKETGCPSSLDLNKAESYALEGPENIETMLAELRQAGYRKH